MSYCAWPKEFNPAFTATLGKDVVAAIPAPPASEPTKPAPLIAPCCNIFLIALLVPAVATELIAFFAAALPTPLNGLKAISNHSGTILATPSPILYQLLISPAYDASALALNASASINAFCAGEAFSGSTSFSSCRALNSRPLITGNQVSIFAIVRPKPVKNSRSFTAASTNCSVSLLIFSAAFSICQSLSIARPLPPHEVSSG